MKWDCKDWKAWCDHMPGPGQPTLHVTGTCTFPTPGYTAELRPSANQPIAYPKALDVDLIVTEPKEAQSDILTEIEVRLDREGGPEHDVINILGAGSVSVEHIETS
jgi:hypothetical protein